MKNYVAEIIVKSTGYIYDVSDSEISNMEIAFFKLIFPHIRI